jgi:hypothetical protein
LCNLVFFTVLVHCTKINLANLTEREEWKHMVSFLVRVDKTGVNLWGIDPAPGWRALEGVGDAGRLFSGRCFCSRLHAENWPSGSDGSKGVRWFLHLEKNRTTCCEN